MNGAKCMWKILVLAGITGAAVSSAAAAKDYTVQSVTGKVTYMKDGGDWASLEQGGFVSDSTQINVGLNSKLVIAAGSEQITIGQMKRGTVGKLTGKSSPAGSQTSAPKRDVSGEAKGDRRAVQTAASRADDINDEDDWVD